MKFSILREDILKPLQMISGVIERRQTMPILSNILLDLQDNEMIMTATDLEVELITRFPVEGDTTAGRTTLPARKFADICRTLPEGARLELQLDGERAKIKSGRSRFTLSTLPADDYPSIKDADKISELSLTEHELKRIIAKTQFSMAQQDVRYYINGLLTEVTRDSLRTVATDGHRMSMCVAAADANQDETMQFIVPRKGILELARLLKDTDKNVRLKFGTNHLRVEVDDIQFTTKLIDGKFPDYERVIPVNISNKVTANTENLKQALVRTSILSNEKYRGIRIVLSEDSLQAVAHNPEMEEAEEVVSVDYKGDNLEIGFNVSYIIDALNAIESEEVELCFGDANSSCLMLPKNGDNYKYVIMPMRL